MAKKPQRRFYRKVKDKSNERRYNVFTIEKEVGPDFNCSFIYIDFLEVQGLIFVNLNVESEDELLIEYQSSHTNIPKLIVKISSTRYSDKTILVFRSEIPEDMFEKPVKEIVENFTESFVEKYEQLRDKSCSACVWGPKFYLNSECKQKFVRRWQQ